MDPMGLFPAPLDSHEIVQAMEMNPLHSHDSKVHQPMTIPKTSYMDERKAVFFQVQFELSKMGLSWLSGFNMGDGKKQHFMGIIPSHHKDHLDSPGWQRIFEAQ